MFFSIESRIIPKAAPIAEITSVFSAILCGILKYSDVKGTIADAPPPHQGTQLNRGLICIRGPAV